MFKRSFAGKFNSPAPGDVSASTESEAICLSNGYRKLDACLSDHDVAPDNDRPVGHDSFRHRVYHLLSSTLVCMWVGSKAVMGMGSRSRVMLLCRLLLL